MLYTIWKVFRFNRREEKSVAARFYKDLEFRKADLALKKAYFMESPYRASRKYWGEASYGETPLTVLETLGRKLGLKGGDVFVDLGAGRGRAVLFMRHIFGCRAIGIERVPSFVETAKRVSKNLCVEGVEFYETDLRSLKGLEGSVFYAAWTCFSEELVRAMTCFFEQLPKGAKVATVSEKVHSQSCRLIGSFTAPFAWGEGEVYLHEIV